MKRILFLPPGMNQPWYVQIHYEYLIRYLSDEFFIEMATVPYEPYDNFLDRFPETSPLERDPRNYDLIVPLWPQHAGVPATQEWFDKMALVMYEPGEGHSARAKFLAGATPYADQAEYKTKCYPVRFGIDTELFKPFPMVREDNLLHVGILGSHAAPRRMIKEAIKPLFDLEGVRIMIYPSPWVNNGGTPESIEELGGQEFLKHCVTGNKTWIGVPNCYNQLDVVLRVDCQYGYSFPTLEAAACGVPVIATDCGIDHLITEAGGGILIKGNPPMKWLDNSDELRDKVREAVIFMRDNPKERKQMGKTGRREIEKNWTWEKHLDRWRIFLRAAT